MSDRNSPPEGECTCSLTDQDPCDYCQKMNLWAYIELYGEDDPGLYQPPGDEIDEEEEPASPPAKF